MIDILRTLAREATMFREKSVAPLPSGHHLCPECGEYSAFYDAYFNANTCSRVLCGYFERVTDDYTAREWSEAEIRELIRQMTA